MTLQLNRCQTAPTSSEEEKYSMDIKEKILYNANQSSFIL